MTPKIGIALFAAGSLLALDTGIAQADVRNSTVFQIADGENCGRTNRDNDGRDRAGDNYQACAEHATLAQLNDGRDIVMFRLASKDVLDGEEVYRRAQLACSSITLTPQGPQLNVDKYVTRNNGNQYRQAHASVAVPIDGGQAVAVFYNNRPNENTERYAQVFDKDCNSLSAQTRVMQKNNDDVCASAENGSHIPWMDTDGVTRVAATCGGNGNGRDDGWAYETMFSRQPDGTYQIQKMWDVSIEPREERTRGTGMVIPEENLFAVCMSAGNAQPTDRGVRCYGVDLDPNGEQGANADSRLLWRQYVAQREGEIYQTQIKIVPSLTVANEATATWQTLIRRRRRGKGSTYLQTARVAFSRDGMDIMALPVQGAFPGGDATHRTMVATPWGKDGQEKDAIMLISTSVNGSPNAMANAQILSWNGETKTFYRERQVGLNSAIDNAWISNIYGNNPNTQGRNHIQAVVMSNPYYGVAGGFRSDVKTFVATAATPRLMREGTDIAQDKLAFQLVLTPAVLAPDVVEDPVEEEPIEPTPDGEDDVGDGTPPGDNGPNSGSVGGVGCSATSSTGFGTFALLGLALMVVFGTRRRYNR
jgi:hypothetical protein